MHSKIYQISTKPIEKEDRIGPSMFYGGSESFADYIGDEVEEQDRQEYIDILAEMLKGIFTKDRDMLVYKGIGTFLENWVNNIKKQANDIITDGKSISDAALYRIRMTTERTHLDSASRFCIDEWCGTTAEPMSEFIYFVSSQLKVGDRLHIGSIIDFHW